MTIPAGRFGRAQAYTLWLLWLGYGSFYFCRANASIFAVGLDRDVGLSDADIALVLGALKLTYGLGQLINGQLAERVSPRVLLAVGMLGSAALNVLFGLGAGLYFYLFVWALNGYCQALGWAPTMRVAANWYPPEHRGRAVGLIGTGYSAAGVAVAVVAGFAAERFGWRGALYLPAAILTFVALYLVVALRDAPPGGPVERVATPREPLLRSLIETARDRRLWLLAAALLLIDAGRFGFTDWGVKHLMDVQGGAIDDKALIYTVLPLAGALGAVSAGWLSDRAFARRRVPAIVTYAGLLALAGHAYGRAVTMSVPLSIAALSAVGFALGGSQTLLVGAGPMDLSRARRPAAAVGFVNMWGYLGAFGQLQLTPRLIQVPLFGSGPPDWSRAVALWSGSAAAAALILLPLWRARAGSPD